MEQAKHELVAEEKCKLHGIISVAVESFSSCITMSEYIVHVPGHPCNYNNHDIVQ